MCGYRVAGTIAHYLSSSPGHLLSKDLQNKTFSPLPLENEDFELDTVSSPFHLKTPFYKPISLK